MRRVQVASGNEGSGSVAVEVLRPDDGKTIHVRSLSPAFGGLFIHYVKKRSYYCHPTDCYPGCRRQKRDWRGYTPVEFWEEHRKAWFPAVLEVTEYLHVELADRWDRWQVWELYRPEKLGDKRFPTIPKLLRQEDGGDYPPAFVVLPTLRRLLGSSIRDLDEKNPMPARTYMRPSQAPPPVEAPPVVTQEQMKEFRKRLGLGETSRNGHPK